MRILFVACIFGFWSFPLFAETACDGIYQGYVGSVGSGFGGNHIKSLQGTTFKKESDILVKNHMSDFFKSGCRPDMSDEAFQRVEFRAYHTCRQKCFDSRVASGDKLAVDKAHYCDELCAEYHGQATNWFKAFQAGKASCKVLPTTDKSVKGQG